MDSVGLSIKPKLRAELADGRTLVSLLYILADHEWRRRGSRFATGLTVSGPADEWHILELKRCLLRSNPAALVKSEWPPTFINEPRVDGTTVAFELENDPATGGEVFWAISTAPDMCFRIHDWRPAIFKTHDTTKRPARL